MYFTGITGKNTINIVYLNKLSSTRVYGPKGKKKKKVNVENVCIHHLQKDSLFLLFDIKFKTLHAFPLHQNTP